MEQQSFQIGLSKFDGAGNDFLIMLDLENRVQITPEEVIALTNRQSGIGADGFITVTGPSGGGDVTMSLLNQDGSFAEISGNGLRCVAHAVVRAGVVASGSFWVMTGAGLRRVSCDDPVGTMAQAEASMGHPVIDSLHTDVHEAYVSVGNPHLVRVVDDVQAIDVEREGQSLQPLRSGGINVEFIEILNQQEIKLGVYERGVGPTLACGSGSVAATLASHAMGLTDAEVVVHNPGGPLGVRIVEGEAWLYGETHHIADLVTALERSS
jgi:diaminopimelate epimerase